MFSTKSYCKIIILYSSSAYDPGWNDPPTMAYAAASQPAAKSKPSLNKRVAFPMQTSDIAANTKVQTSSAGLPMPFARVKQQPPPPAQSMSTAVTPPTLLPANLPPPPKAESLIPAHHLDDSIPEPIANLEVSHTTTLHTLQTILKSLTGLDSVKTNEIEKRLVVLSTMWLQNRFDSRLQLLLAQISECKHLESHITPQFSLSDLLSHNGLTISQFVFACRYFEWRAHRSY